MAYIWPIWGPGASDRPNKAKIGHFGPFWAILGQNGLFGPISRYRALYRPNRPFWAIFGTPFLTHFGPFWAKNVGKPHIGLKGASQKGSQIWPKSGHFGPYLGPPILRACQIKVTGLGDLAQEVAIMAQKGSQKGSKMGHIWDPYFEGPQPYGYGAWGFGPKVVKKGPKRGPKMTPFWHYLGHIGRSGPISPSPVTLIWQACQIGVPGEAPRGPSDPVVLARTPRNMAQNRPFWPYLGPLFGPFWPFWAISPKVSRVHFEGPKIGGPRMAQIRPLGPV